MKLVRNLEDFYIHNDKDLEKILRANFSNFLKHTPLEDLKSDLYLHFQNKKHVENYAPFDIKIDLESNTWFIRKTSAKLSSYLYTIIKNHLLAYHTNNKPEHLSFDDFNDQNYCEENNSKLKFLNNHRVENIDLLVDLNNILDRLKEKTMHKGNLVCDTDLELSVAKTIDKCGDKGCPENTLYKSVFNYDLMRSNASGVEFLLLSQIDKIEKKGLIKSKINEDGQKTYFIDQVERRSLYKLFSYYMQGLKDKEISEKFNMTVAGVGTLKRQLRKELKLMFRT